MCIRDRWSAASAIAPRLPWRRLPRCACRALRGRAGSPCLRLRVPALRTSPFAPCRKLYALEEHLRAAAPVVERLPLLRQRLDVGGAELLLQEPVRGVRGEGKQAPQPQAAHW